MPLNLRGPVAGALVLCTICSAMVPADRLHRGERGVAHVAPAIEAPHGAHTPEGRGFDLTPIRPVAAAVASTGDPAAFQPGAFQHAAFQTGEKDDDPFQV